MSYQEKFRVTAIEADPDDKTKIIVTLFVNRLEQKHESSFSLPLRGALCRINGIAIERGGVYGKTKLAEMILKHLHYEVWAEEDDAGILFTLLQETFPEVDYLCW